MEIKEGTTRIVVVGDNQVIKVPKNEKIRRRLDSDSAGELIERYFAENDSDCLNSLVKLIASDLDFSTPCIEGVLANRVEAKYGGEETILKVIVPTRFSIDGIVNVQDLSLDVVNDGFSLRKFNYPDWLCKHMQETYTDHTFAHINNYGRHDGKIKLRDYGDKNIVRILMECVDATRVALDTLEV